MCKFAFLGKDDQFLLCKKKIHKKKKIIHILPKIVLIAKTNSRNKLYIFKNKYSI